MGMFASPVHVPAKYVLRNVPVGLGPGVYPVHFLVMDKANFSVTLGLDFMYRVRRQIIARASNNRRAASRC